jgi:hypothetical protein
MSRFVSCREGDKLSEAVGEAASHKKGKVTDTKLTPEQLEEVRYCLNIITLQTGKSYSIRDMQASICTQVVNASVGCRMLVVTLTSASGTRLEHSLLCGSCCCPAWLACTAC